MPAIVLAAVWVLTLLAAAPALAAERTGRILVMLEDARPSSDAHAASARAVLSTAGVRRSGPSVPEIGLVTVAGPGAGRPLGPLLERLRADPRVRSAEVEHRVSLRATPNDPAITTPDPNASGIPLQWTVERSGLFRAWDVTRGDGALVAVIDTGIDGSHPDLQSKIAESVDLDSEPGHGPATADENGHGTHVSSLACGAADNRYGLAGAGWNCKLIVVKTDLTDGSIAAGIMEAVRRGAHSINMSFGSDANRAAPDAVRSAIEEALRRDVVLVAAANEGDAVPEDQGWPANALQPTGTGPDLAKGRGLTVTAANARDERASFAGRGSQISLAAYGAYEVSGTPNGIFGAFPSGTTDLERTSLIPPSSGCECRTSLGGDSRFAYLQGTSMAAPQVAGVAAMLRVLNPDLDVTEILRIMKESARRIGTTGFSPEVGWGILDAGTAVDRARRIDHRAPSSRARAVRTVRRSRTFTVRWTGRDAAPGALVASGLSRYEVWRSKNGGRYRRVSTTTGTRMRVRGRPGDRFRFYTVAVDAAGNREARPSRADAVTRFARRR